MPRSPLDYIAQGSPPSRGAVDSWRRDDIFAPLVTGMQGVASVLPAAAQMDYQRAWRDEDERRKLAEAASMAGIEVAPQAQRSDILTQVAGEFSRRRGLKEGYEASGEARAAGEYTARGVERGQRAEALGFGIAGRSPAQIPNEGAFRREFVPGPPDANGRVFGAYGPATPAPMANTPLAGELASRFGGAPDAYLGAMKQPLPPKPVEPRPMSEYERWRTEHPAAPRPPPRGPRPANYIQGLTAALQQAVVTMPQAPPAGVSQEDWQDQRETALRSTAEPWLQKGWVTPQNVDSLVSGMLLRAGKSTSQPSLSPAAKLFADRYKADRASFLRAQEAERKKGVSEQSPQGRALLSRSYPSLVEAAKVQEPGVAQEFIDMFAGPSPAPQAAGSAPAGWTPEMEAAYQADMARRRGQ